MTSEKDGIVISYPSRIDLLSAQCSIQGLQMMSKTVLMYCDEKVWSLATASMSLSKNSEPSDKRWNIKGRISHSLPLGEYFEHIVLVGLLQYELYVAQPLVACCWLAVRSLDIDSDSPSPAPPHSALPCFMNNHVKYSSAFASKVFWVS